VPLAALDHALSDHAGALRSLAPLLGAGDGAEHLLDLPAVVEHRDRPVVEVAEDADASFLDAPDQAQRDDRLIRDLAAFFREHRNCGELDAAVEGERVFDDLYVRGEDCPVGRRALTSTCLGGRVRLACRKVAPIGRAHIRRQGVADASGCKAREG
jgi:hypothetical protein